MFELVPMTERVKKKRELYRSFVPRMCTARLRIITDFYQKNPQLTGALKRAKLFKEIAPKYADRNGGYTRVTRTGPRRGDAAEMAVIELV